MFAQLGYYICVPFAWLTRLFYTWTGSYGVALILFTLLVKLVLLPFQLKSKKSMLRMNRMQSKIKDIQTRYANNREKQQQEMADLYAREGVNPMSGCLWSFLPFPILIALYYIIRTPLRYFMSLSQSVIAEITTLATSLGYVAATDGQAAAYEQIYLAKFIHEHWADFDGKFAGLIDLNYNFLGMDLSAMKSNGNTQMNGSGRAMMYMMPLMTVWMGYILPAALCVYWICNAAFSCIQELFLNKYFNKILDREETDKEREKREKRYAKMQAARENYNQQMVSGKGEKKPQPQKKKKSSDGEYGGSTTEAGRVGQRPYARGRAFSEDHYNDN